MPKKHLLTGAEIRSFRPTQRAHGTFFSISSGPLVAPYSKCATVVSKKVAVKATDRNRVKRRARTVLYPLVKSIGTPLGIILTAKKGAAEASYTDMISDIQQTFQKVYRL